ncbi:unnamed protein product [Laminaria digitata]
MLSYADALAKIGCENVETMVRKRRVLFAVARLFARMGDERVPKRAMFGEGGG